MNRIVVIVVAAIALHASADSGGADRAAADAQTRAANGDFIGAAAKYREAFSQDPRPELMCNVGVAYYKAKDLPKAHRYLDQCLTIGTSLDRTFIESVKKVLAAVDSALANSDFTPVDLLVQPTTATTTVEGGVPFDEPILGSRRVWFPFGRYRLTVHAEGHVDRVLHIDAKDRKPQTATAALQRTPADSGSAGAAAPAEGSASVGSGSDVVVPPPPATEPAPRPSLVAPIAVTAVTVGVGATALLFYIAAVDSADKAGMTADFTAYTKLKNEAIDRKHMAWAFGAAAGAGAIASGYLWYRYSRAPRVEVQASGSGGGVVLSGRW